MMRTPAFPNIFACLLGIGVQVTMMMQTLLCLTVLFFVFENFRPFYYYTGMIILALMGYFNGFVTARVLKYFGTTDWVFSAATSSLVFPTWLYATAFIADVVEMIDGKTIRLSAAIGFGFLWLAINTPLCFLGAYKGYITGDVRSSRAIGKIKKDIPV